MDYASISSTSHRHLTEEITRLRAEVEKLKGENQKLLRELYTCKSMVEDLTS